MPIHFASSPRASVGVEMELGLIDPTSRELVKGAHELLIAMGREHPNGSHPKAKPELLQSVVEIITGVCQTIGEARADLTSTLTELTEYTDRAGLLLMCSGTHPFTDPMVQEVTPNDRYHRLIDDMQWPARQMQIFGIHVHVGVRSAEKAIAMVNGMSAYIPHFLALSASSPFWMGHDTGLASTRSKVFEGLPTAGPPWQLDGWAEFERFMDTLITARTIASIREVWWDIRPHPGFGTIELRICDGLPTLREVAAMAALSQCLVQRFDMLIDRGYRIPYPVPWVVRENKWRAARHGVDAAIIVDNEGDTVPLRDALSELVEELTPIARRLDCAAELQDVLAIVERGPSYLRQREVVAAGGTLVDVVDSLVEELRLDGPRPRSADIATSPGNQPA
ncbi:MAG: glutamate--cysteine ligase [Candidatus Dormibacteraeota bacterium]|uniref:Putative glutamate--cysteine ligase 2 n=1 Tax=Candidatus Amunia macphersoniae TaxID=3127014 RepID=A0A934NGK0_9BACT|nr:glutamate--cysteine ligase [Candidatus Dormibacteraeota bacterium]